MTGVFDRGRSGSNEIWRTPTTLARHADTTTVPIRECLADVFKHAHVENDDPFDAVDADEMERVYDSLAASERIVGGYTKFGFEDKGARHVYCTADPDAVEEEPAVTQGVGVPFGNPLFRAEGELFENKNLGGGVNLDATPPLASQSLRSLKTSSRVASHRKHERHTSTTPSTSRTSAKLFASSSKRTSAKATAPRQRAFPESAATLPRQPLFPSTTRLRRPPSHSHMHTHAHTLSRAMYSRPMDSPIRPPLDPKKAALVEKIEAVLGEVRARIRGAPVGESHSVPAKSLGTRFAAVSRDRTSERSERRRVAMLEALARPALNRWRATAKAKVAKREEALFEKALAAFTKTSTRRVFSRWLEFVDESQEMHALAARAVARFASTATCAAFARWSEWADDRKERRKLAKRAVAWWTGRSKAAAFARWCDFTVDRRERRAMAKNAVKWWVGRSKTAAWLRWRDAVVDAQTARWAVRFFVDRTRSAAFARWAEFADQSRDARSIATRAANHWLHATTRRALSTWSERAAALAEDRERLTRAVKRFTSAKLAEAFARWVHNVMYIRDARELLRKSVNQFDLRIRRSAFARWVEFTNETQVARETLTRAAGFWSNRAAGTAFEGWLDFLFEKRKTRELVRRAVVRFESRTGAAAFTTWVEFADAARFEKNGKSRAETHFKRKSLALGLNAFMDNLVRVLNTHRALSNWTNQTTAKALARWVNFVSERRAAMRLDPVAFKFFRKGLLKFGFENWREFSLVSQLEREEFQLAVDRYRYTALQRFWPRWVNRVRASVAEEDADEHRARVVAREFLEAWRTEMWVSHCRRENTAARFIKAWGQFAARRRVLQSCLSTARALQYTRNTKKAFHAWSSVWLVEAKATLGLALTRRNLIRRVLKSWREETVATQFDRHSAFVADAHLNAKLKRSSFAALSSHWARKVLTRSFVYGQQKKLAQKAWKGWSTSAWENKLRRVEDELGAVEAFGFHGTPQIDSVAFPGFDTLRSERSNGGSPTRGFSMSHSPPNGPWLSAGPGKNTKASMGNRDKWKFY